MLMLASLDPCRGMLSFQQAKLQIKPPPLRCPTAVWIPLFPGAGDLVAIFVHAPALAGAAVALGGLEVAFVSTAGDVGAWGRQEGG